MFGPSFNFLFFSSRKLAGDNLIGYCNSKGTQSEDSFYGSLDISIKDGGPNDFCTQVDVQNEQHIMAGIRKTFPNHGIIGEEEASSNDKTIQVPSLWVSAIETSTTDKSNNNNTNNQSSVPPPTWVIDPIDGTTNFASGLGITCVSIALCDTIQGCPQQRPVVGVIYAPMTRELYLAVRGYGAFRNGQKIINRRRDHNKQPKPVQQAIICCEMGYPRNADAISKMVGALERILLRQCRAIRQLGSGCLDLCYVATGRLDVVYAGVATEGWKPWDYAAGLVICQEAGCVMESIDQKSGENFDLYSKSIICAESRELLEEIRTIITFK